MMDAATQGLIKKITEVEDEGRNLLIQEQLDKLINSDEFQEKFAAKKARLAITDHRQEILDLVRDNRVVIICGTTGCGKTTHVAQFLMDQDIRESRGANSRILITQPRRISAMSIAERIAAERLESVGDSVGYTIRLQTKPGRHINLCTTGVLLQLFLGEPDLPNLRYLIIDEIHERDLNCDFALVMIKELLKRNPHIKALLMSATLHSELFFTYFDHAPVLNADGQTFPVKEYYLDTIAELAKQRRIKSFMVTPPDDLHGREKKLAIHRSAKDFDYNLLQMLLVHDVNEQHLQEIVVEIFG